MKIIFAYIANNNLILVSADRKLYIQGDNSYAKCSIDIHKRIIDWPVPMNIELLPKEILVKVQSYPANICIRTSQRLIFVATRNKTAYNTLANAIIESGSYDYDPDEPIALASRRELDTKTMSACDFNMRPQYGFKFSNNEPIIISDVKWAVFGRDSVMYGLSSEEIVLTVLNVSPDNHPDRNPTESIVLRSYQDTTGAHCSSYEICMPFKYKSRHVTPSTDFVHIYAGAGIHHVLAPDPGPPGTEQPFRSESPFRGPHCLISWNWFRANFRVDPSKIHWSSITNNLCIEQYGYVYTCQEHILTLLETRGHIFASFGHGEESYRFHPDDVYPSTESYAGRIYGEHNIVGVVLLALNNKYLQKLSLENQIIVILHTNNIVGQISPVSDRGNVVFVCLSGVSWYGMIGESCFSFILGENIHFVSAKYMLKHQCSISFQNVNHTKIYLPCRSNDIIYAKFNGSLLIKTRDTKVDSEIKYNYYYLHPYNMYNFSSFSFLPKASISAPEIKSAPQFVNHHLIPATRGIISVLSINYQVKTNESFLPVLMNIVATHKVNILPSVSFSDGILDMAAGSGVRKTFIDAAARELASQIFIKGNFLTIFNIDFLKANKSDDELKMIGKAIVYCINILNVLPFRLPIPLLACLRREHPTRANFEFFAYMEDREAYIMLKSIENQQESLNEAGHNDYICGLMSICKYDCSPSTLIIAKKIADGILENSEAKFHLMNIPTIDYFFSENYEINIELFISKIEFANIFSEEQRTKILGMIRGLSQIELRTLLFNWAGASHTQFLRYYVIGFTEANRYLVTFSTCSAYMQINMNIFGNTSYFNTFRNMITTEWRHMQG